MLNDSTGWNSASQIINRIATRAAAQRSPHADGDVVRDEPRRAVSKGDMNATGVAAAGGHHRRRRGSGQQAGRVQRIVGIALSAGIEAIGNGAVGALIALKDRASTPPTETAEI